MSEFPPDDTLVGKRVWNTMEGLRSIASDAGCSPLEFDAAVRLCNDDTSKVATYVQLLLIRRCVTNLGSTLQQTPAQRHTQ
jgi:hypothetical protein